MPNPTTDTPTSAATAPARTHAEAGELLRRPFAPGAIGFRAMTKVPYNGDPFGGAQVAAYIGAQSVLQRLNAVTPGRWRQEFKPVDPPPGSKRLCSTSVAPCEKVAHIALAEPYDQKSGRPSRTRSALV